MNGMCGVIYGSLLQANVHKASPHADRIACEALQHSTLSRYIMHVHPTHADTMRFKRARPFLCSGAPTRGIELLMRVRMGCLCVHERTRHYGGKQSRFQNSMSCLRSGC
jgi:hypothetical protein